MSSFTERAGTASEDCGVLPDTGLAALPETLISFARFLADTPASAIPDAVMERAADCVLDCLGAAAAGQDEPMVPEIAEELCQIMGRGGATIWFSGTGATKGTGASPIAAATANALAATILDVDDGHRKAKGHPGAAVIASAFATAEDVGASHRDFLAAVVMGYEAAVRVALGRTAERQHDTASGLWSGIGAAVAASRLAGASAERMAQAILIAEQQAPQLASAMRHGFAGSHVKEGIPWSVLTGTLAARLARRGFTGYPQTFDMADLYRPGALMEAGTAFGAIDGLYFKPYACCRWIHAAIDGVTSLLDDHRLDPGEIERIDILTFERAVGLENAVAPATPVDAQFSIPFCVALAALRGRQALLPLRAADLGDPAIIGLARRIEPRFDPTMEALFPALAPAKVRLYHRGQEYRARVDAAFGDPTNPMDRSDLRRKFEALASGRIDAARIEALIRTLSDFPGQATLGVRTTISGYL